MLSGRVIGGRRVKRITLFERFNIDWLIRQVNGNNFPIFEGRSREESLEILTDLQKQGYTTLRNTESGIIAE